MRRESESKLRQAQPLACGLPEIRVGLGETPELFTRVRRTQEDSRWLAADDRLKTDATAAAAAAAASLLHQ